MPRSREFGQSASIKALEKLILLQVRTRAAMPTRTAPSALAPLRPPRLPPSLHSLFRTRRTHSGALARARARWAGTCFIIEWPPSRTANQPGNWFIIISLCFHYPG